MFKKCYVFLYLTEVIIVILASIGQKSPGYMDADYYYVNAVSIANGKGFQEFFLWNYLDDPQGIPHPAFTYWMPLASLVSSAALFIAGKNSFVISRIPFFFLSGFVPVITAHLTMRITGDRKFAWLAALFSIFSGFYLVYISLPENFLIYLLLGACFFEIEIALLEKTNHDSSRHILLFVFLGIITGLMYLTRADGILWFLAGVVFLIDIWKKGIIKIYRLERLFAILSMFAGFGLITGGWFYRNFVTFGSWVPSGGIKTLWLTNYNQTFIYPPSLLTIDLWLKTGFTSHIKDYLSAFWLNFKTLFIVQGEIFLAPLIVVAFFKYKNSWLIKYISLIFVLQFFISTFVFPFSGSRGGFLHSGSAFQVIWWMLAGVGFWKFLDWGVQKRKWSLKRSSKLFIPAISIITLVFSGIVYWQKVIGFDIKNPIWEQEYQQYNAIEEKLILNGYLPDESILIKNPPGYYATSGRPAFVIPDGSLYTLNEVAQKFHIKLLAIDEDHPQGLDYFYYHGTKLSEFQFLFSLGKYHIYLINKDVDG